MFDYFDIHSHLYFPDFDADRVDEIEKLKENKIAAITVGTDLQSSQKAIALADARNNLFATVGQHPGEVTTDSKIDDISSIFEKLAENKKVVAVGECGLDYFRMDKNDTELKNIQKKIFEKHIELALKLDKPLMLHIRPQKGTMDAYHDALEILENYGGNNYGGNASVRELHRGEASVKLRGNAHFFVGDLDVLQRFLALGFTISFTGVITFTHDYDEVIRQVPLEMIMSETDAPLVAPVPYRGKRNSPLYVPEVVKKIVELRGEDFEVVRKQMVENALRVFSISS